LEKGVASETCFMCSIHTALKESRNRLWEHCEAVLVRCFEEYMNFATRVKLFQLGANGTDDSLWCQELESLHHVLILVDRFVALKSSFYENPTLCDENLVSMMVEGKRLSETLGDVFRRHLRSVHVEAMNTFGRLLSNETWVLDSFNSIATTEEDATPIETIFLNSLKEALRPLRSRSKLSSCCANVRDSVFDFRQLTADGNPFRSVNVRVHHSKARTTASTELDRGEALHRSGMLYSSMATWVEDMGVATRLAPQCLANGLLEWFARLLIVMEDLPLIVEDVSAVFANLCDLYVTTVLRICAGSAANERYILGIAEPELFFADNGDHLGSPMAANKSNSGTANMFVSLRQKRRPSRIPQRSHPTISNTLDAEICSPLPEDKDNVEKLRKFIVRAQKSLQDVVNLDMVDSWLVDSDADTLEQQTCEIARVLEKRVGAAMSLYAIAGLVEAAYALVRVHLASCPVGGNFVENLASLHGYMCALGNVTPTLVSVANGISSQRAVGSTQIVKEITGNGPGWEECKLNEDPNEYVDSLCDKCALIWGFLSASAKLPVGAMQASWAALLTAAYLSLLEGFARIPFCSIEGRALMAIDLASFSLGVRPMAVSERLECRSLVATPPHAELEKGMSYVDTYIKVYYFPNEEKIAWIRRNYKHYQVNHALALIAAVASSLEASPEISFAAWKKEVICLYKNTEGTMR
jgi:hypothetical protein